MIAIEEVKALRDEVEGFKIKNELLWHKIFPTFFDEEGNLVLKESFMRLLAKTKEVHRFIKVEIRSQWGIKIMNLYNNHYDVLFFPKNIFMEWRKIYYGDITNLKGTIIEAWSCDIPYDREWRTLMDLNKWAPQWGFTLESQITSTGLSFIARISIYQMRLHQSTLALTLASVLASSPASSTSPARASPPSTPSSTPTTTQPL